MRKVVAPGLYETLAMRAGHPIDLTRHLARLRRSCRELSLPRPPSQEQIRHLLEDLVRSSGRPPRAIRLEWRPSPAGSFRLTLFSREPSQLRRRGARALWAPRRRDGSLSRWRHKTLDRESIDRALARARARGADEVLFRNEKGEVCEGAIANVLWMRDGVLCTPGLDCGILAGIARGRMIEAARGLGIGVREGRFAAADLQGADEAVLTNALVLAVPLLSVGGRRLGRRGSRSILERVRRHALRLRVAGEASRKPPGGRSAGARHAKIRRRRRW